MDSSPRDTDATGEEKPYEILMDVPFAGFIVTIKLGRGNEFIGIKKIASQKDFLTPEQKIRAFGGNDTSDYYNEQ